jgi:hypothetical protein
MRYSEIRARPAAPESHPFAIDIAVNSGAFGDVERAMEGRPAVRLLARIDQADHCLVHVGCWSAMVRRAVRDRWGWPTTESGAGSSSR